MGVFHRADSIPRLACLVCFCHETISRRCRKRARQGPQFTLAELHRLVGGVGGQHLTKIPPKAHAGWSVIWSESAVDVRRIPDQFKERRPFNALMSDESGQNWTRSAPRTIRLIAGGKSLGAIVTATMLGHLLRCMFYRNGGCSSDGCCKHRGGVCLWRVHATSESCFVPSLVLILVASAARGRTIGALAQAAVG